MADSKSTDTIISGDGIKTSQGVVLLSCNLACRVCGQAELFEWPEKNMSAEEVEGIDVFGLIIAVAHSKNWIAQRILNVRDGKGSLFVLCPTCLELFMSATTTESVKDAKDKT